ncbi:hypothetical protein STRDD10_01780 [Streptococcus sp. DD10]|uniref:hypothetical protein n=1 Tax=Streptococcus sp. DD10 TaxID=1777878 RepID=UPI000791206E|nr:hypothetical protein [Streptococcus sp. DD10]KXT72717.1 hypothetical protein STRDD10_01780 [Streptococcus sp. DD10]
MKAISISAILLALILFFIIGFAALFLTGNFFSSYLAPFLALLAGIVHIGTMLLLELARPNEKDIKK